jgi:hypothetical protein
LKLAGEHRFEAPRELVWRALLDPAILARTLPGCERLEQVEENDFRGVLNVQVGPVKGQFQGTLLLSDLKVLESYRMKLDGSGPAGFLRGEGTVALAEAGDGTLLSYDLEAQVGGRMAGVGQRLLDSSARSIARQGLEGLGRQLAALQAAAPPAAGMPAASVPPAPLPPPSPTQAAVAARVARDVAADLVPPSRRPWIIAVVVAVLGVLVFTLFRACSG